MDGCVTVSEAKRLVQEAVDNAANTTEAVTLDLHYRGSVQEVRSFNAWLEALEHRKVIVTE